MIVIVEHRIRDPQRFWKTAQDAIPEKVPAGLTLHHSFPSPDGADGVCVWEAPTLEMVREFLDTAMGEFSENRYYPTENREGIAVPARFAATEQPA